MTKEIQLTSGLRPIKLATFDVDLKKTLMWFSVVPNSPVPEHQIQKYLKLCLQKFSVVPNNNSSGRQNRNYWNSKLFWFQLFSDLYFWDDIWNVNSKLFWRSLKIKWQGLVFPNLNIIGWLEIYFCLPINVYIYI